jgi:hypothetical protein
VSAHIGSPLPFGPEVGWGWRQTPDVSTHNGLPLPWKGVNCGWRSALPGQTRGLHGVRRRPSSPGRSHRASAATEIAPLGKVAGCRQRIPLASPCESFSSTAWREWSLANWIDAGGGVRGAPALRRPRLRAIRNKGAEESGVLAIGEAFELRNVEYWQRMDSSNCQYSTFLSGKSPGIANARISSAP